MWQDLGMSEASPEYLREHARKMGYHIIEKVQGINSMLAGLCRHHPQLVVGLDSSSSQLYGHMSAGIYPLAQLSALYVANTGASISEDLDHLAMEDPPVQPAIRRFVAIPEMPLMEGGEIDRTKLRGLGRKPTEREERDEPGSEIEQKVVQLWKEELTLSQVNREESLFELGGDSLTAVRLANRLRETFGVSLSVRTLFEMPTIPQLVQVLAKKLQQEGKPSPLLAEQPEALSTQELLNNIDQIPDLQVDALLQELAGNEFSK
jgi:acyl carrier protein